MVLFTHFVRANQQLGFFISERSTVNTQSVHKTSKSVIAEMNLTNTTSITRKKTKYGHFTFWNLQICPRLMVKILELFYDTLP